MTPIKAEYQNIPLKSLSLSDTNPRASFDDRALKELAESIKIHGVLQPLLVRPHPKKKDAFEIISGARRFKAATLAKIEKDVPCRIKTGLTDEEIRAIQIVENLQRQDVLPLDEAEGIAELMKCKGFNLELIAQQIGKETTYVAKRLRLLELTGEAKKFLRSGILTQEHVNLLARLTPDQQREILEACTREWDDLMDVVSPAKMKIEIEERFFLDLSRAPWDKADPKLIVKAGACTSCPKMAGNNRNLFDDVKKGDTCTDPSCFAQKFTAFVQITESEKKMKAYKLSESYSPEKTEVLGRQDYVPCKKTECEHVAIGFYVDGDSMGKQIYICPKSSDCKSHWKNSRRGESGETAAQKETRLAEERKRKAEITLRRKVLDEIECKAPEALKDPDDLLLVALALWHGIRRDVQIKVLKLRDWMPDNKAKGEYFDPTAHGTTQIEALAKKLPADLARFCIYMALVEHMDEAPTSYDFESDKRTAMPDPLMIMAKKYSIDSKDFESEEPKKAKAAAKR